MAEKACVKRLQKEYRALCKLLGWMHRKFRANEPLKDFSVGNSCTCLSGKPSLDDQQYYPKSNFGTKSLGKAQRDNHLQKSLFSLEAARVEADDFEEESSVAISKLFHGFLTIGTLGSDPVITDPSTPTFATSVENITEKETEVTENELKLINDELEKVIGAEGDGCNDSSGRNSHVSTGRNSYVSTGRSSHGSTITLSEKPLEGTETNGNGTTICPLQGYLFGSAIELPETTTVVKQEHRTSLGELFQRTKIAEENYVAKSERGEKRTENETDKSVIHLMKKMLKKRMVHGSSRSCTTSTGGNVDSASSETKLHKILHMFHRKVHPESSTAVRKSLKPCKNDIKNNITYERGLQ
ncbi:protein LAZY 1-like isoform X3 [Camellia sinensis]|uniref:protein LAZY 1-like isoform X3 n=1 Tax=Camellia sinensis TaxID=4442 RepID=UPI0010368BFA|nr:protein LAZY 1-like isoform X3 [Camellia sinensis]